MVSKARRGLGNLLFLLGIPFLVAAARKVAAVTGNETLATIWLALWIAQGIAYGYLEEIGRFFYRQIGRIKRKIKR